jgi:hypothetical protein
MRCLLNSVGFQVIASVVLAVLVFGNLTCSHCESLLAETPEIERFEEFAHESSPADVFLKTAAFKTQKSGMHLDVRRCDLPQPASSRKTLNLLCTLLI